MVILKRKVAKLLLLVAVPLMLSPNLVLAASDYWDGGTNIYNSNLGGVGVGTQFPRANLHTFADSGEISLMVDAETEDEELLTFDGSRQQSFKKFGNGNLKLVDTHNNHDIIKIYRNSDDIEFSNGDLHVPKGNIGVGTYSPMSNLQVVASSGEDALRVTTEKEGDELLIFDGGRLQAFKKFSKGNLKLVDLYNGHDILRIYRNSDNVDIANGDLRVPKGRVGIGTTSTPATLTVNGDILAEEIEVVANVADYVFEDSYDLPQLAEVAEFISENKHLPNVTPANSENPEFEEEVVNLGDRFTELLEKTEELFLYTIDQEERIQLLEQSLISK